MINLKEIIKYLENMKLLYIEDDKYSREATLPILEDFFKEIVIAVNGEDGLNKFNENHKSLLKPIDIIITDVNMPKLDGLEMIKKIKEIDNNIIILILSAYNESNFFIKSIEMGVEGYLLKPINIKQLLLVLKKIAEKVHAQEESLKNLDLLYQYQEITNKSAIVSKITPEGIITYVNKAFCEISEFSENELIGKNCSTVQYIDNFESKYKELWRTIKDKKKIWQGVVKNISKSGKPYYTRATIKPIINKYSEIVEYIVLKNNITDVMNPKEQLNDLISSSYKTIVIYIQIEEFCDIEKFYGQKLSLKLEENFSNCLYTHIVKKNEFDKVFILGDGNYILAKNLKNLNENIDSIANNIKKFQQKINNTNVNMSIGAIACDISIIVSLSYGKNALENSKYGIKKLHKTKQDFIIANNLVKEEQEKAKQNLQVLKIVKKALKNKKVISFFQPIICNKTKKIDKYESLVRIIDEKGKIIEPAFFLNKAKEGKYYTQITMRVLENSFKALDQTDAEISINISVLDIEKKPTREKIYKLLELYKNEASRIVFELLEDEDIKDLTLVKEFITKVKKMGVKIAIDDFGAGYSNFQRLFDYQPDIIKIDGSLVKNIEHNKLSLSIIKTIVNFSKEQNIKIVAEYVENESIFNILNNLGVDYSQGYFFGKPTALQKK